tara:strand:+ start:120830 stop:121897 length:1068 start_codon:yes stop_codon:yes gene_type:complete
MKTKLSILITALLFTYQVSAQNVITVDNSVGSNAQYNNLQSAISAANSGDIIYIHASEINYGNINVDKPLTLIGFSHSDADKKTMINNIVLLQDASNTTISGINITNDFIVDNTNPISNLVIENNLFIGPLSGRDIIFSTGGADNVLFRGNVVRGAGFGINTSSTNFNILTNVIISNNVFIATDIIVRYHQSTTIKNNIFLSSSNVIAPVRNLNDDSGDVTVQNCIIYASWSGGGGVVDANSDGVSYNNCMSFNESGSVVNLIGANNLNNQNPLFENLESSNNFNAELDNHHLQAGSPAIGTGAAGVDMGIYDGSAFTFNNFGYTNGIPTVKITNITDRIAPGANLNVTINTNAN